MFSTYYKAKLKNKSKNKSQQKISFTNFLIYSQRSWLTVLSLPPFLICSQRNSLSPSPYLRRSTHNSKLSVLFSPDLLSLYVPISVDALHLRCRCCFISVAASAPSRRNHCCSIQLPRLLLPSRLHLCYVSCWYFSFLRLAYNRICYPLGFNLLGKMVNVENLCVC